MKLFLDACIIIYWCEMREPFYTKFLDHFETITKKYNPSGLAISRLSVLECSVKPLREKDKKIIQIYEDFFNHPELEIIEISADVISKATQLRATYNLKTPDAIQAASALSLTDECRFVSNDTVFNKIPTLKSELL